jgi:hypothetical protein
MPHYNTTDLDPKTLQRLNDLSVSQEEKIYQLFRLVKRPMAWFEVKQYFPNMNECSLKRALTDLTKEKNFKLARLEKTSKKVDHYGVSCYQYALKMNY